MSISAAERHAAATKLGGLIGDKPDLDLGYVPPNSSQAARADNACRIAQKCYAQQCHTQLRRARPKDGMAPA